jgi:hypothetical protein
LAIRAARRSIIAVSLDIIIIKFELILVMRLDSVHTKNSDQKCIEGFEGFG